MSNQTNESSQPRTLVILPTYNEKENLPLLLKAIHEHVPHVHILVVDDNSPDGTGQIADDFAAQDERIWALHRSGKLGLGTAYIEGFRYGLANGYDIIQQMDCDFSHDPADLPRMFEAIKDADLVLGSRNIKGGGTKNWPIYRKAISRGGSLYARNILGIHVKDVTGGFKCWRRETLEAIQLDRIQSEGYSFQIEMTWRAIQRGFRVVEIPIIFADRQFGQSKMHPSIVVEAMGMCWKLRMGLVK
jgi:dolichol-phosphate mannosyltransferase